MQKVRFYSQEEFSRMPRKRQIAIIIAYKEYRKNNPSKKDLQRKLNVPTFFFYDI